MTCHLSIDRKGYEKYPQPFTTHPNLSTYLGGDSPHPIDRIGCTVCHEGMGQSVSFRDAAHMPSSEKQQEEWEKKFGWEQPHLWDYPMLPVKMTEASCAKCHKQEIYVPKADTLNIAYGTYERAGCYACHKTKGFETEKMRKPGPILTKIDSKLSPDWVKTWIRNPRAVKPATWMPRIWYNSNSSSPADAVRNEVEIDAAVAYLFANTEKHEFASRARRAATRRRASRSSSRSAARAATWSAKGNARRSGRAGRSVSPSRTSATRRPTSGSSTGCGIRSTTTPAPTCRTCG